MLAGKKRTASDAGLSQEGDKEGVETLGSSSRCGHHLTKSHHNSSQ